MPNSENIGRQTSICRLWLRLGMFSAPLALAAVFMEVCLAAVPNSYAAKRERLMTMANRTETLILGSSSAYYGISPQSLPGSAFNLANVSQTLYYDNRLLAKVLPRLPNLKRVIIGVGYTSLFFQFHGGELEDWRQYYYQQEWAIPPRRLQDRLDIRMWSRLALSMPPLPLEAVGLWWRAKRQGGRTADDLSIDSAGWWLGSQATGNLSAKAAAIPLKRHHDVMHESNLADNSAYLNDLLARLHGHQIDVMLVTLPVWHTYAEGMNSDVWNRSVVIYERLAREHGARYVSFLQEPRLAAEDFGDPDHLNARGAVHFTAILRAEMERMGV